MKIIDTKKSWESALVAIHNGAFANHAHWHTNSPGAEIDYVGPIALGLKDVAGGALGLFTDNGVYIADWHASPDEFASTDWQIVMLDKPVQTSVLVKPTQEQISMVLSAPTPMHEQIATLTAPTTKQ